MKYIDLIRLLYYLPIERMKELTVCIQNEYEGNVIYRTELYTEEEYKQLEEKIKKLNEYNRRLKQGNDDLKEENKKLKEDVDFYYKSAKQFREQVEKWEKDFVEGRIVEKD